MKIAIIGNGCIGGAARKYLEQRTSHELLIYDPPQGFKAPLHQADLCLVSVPVPTKSFKQDLSILNEVIDLCPQVPILVRSTVLPGTCDKLAKETGKDIMAFPEFLTARRADDDFVSLRNNVLGFSDGISSELRDGLFKRVKEAFPTKHIVPMRSTEAELIKYAHNCFGALKVTFFNGIKDLADDCGADYETIAKWVPDVSNLISRHHMQVPGPDGKRGFGGVCFPKDLAAFMGYVSPDKFFMLLEKTFTLNMAYRGEREFPGIEKVKGEE